MDICTHKNVHILVQHTNSQRETHKKFGVFDAQNRRRHKYRHRHRHRHLQALKHTHTRTFSWTTTTSTHTHTHSLSLSSTHTHTFAWTAKTSASSALPVARKPCWNCSYMCWGLSKRETQKTSRPHRSSSTPLMSEINRKSRGMDAFSRSWLVEILKCQLYSEFPLWNDCWTNVWESLPD